LQLLLRCGCKVTASIRDDNDNSAAHFTPTQKLCLLLKVWLSVDLWVEMAPLERSQIWSCELHVRLHKVCAVHSEQASTAYAGIGLGSCLPRLRYSSAGTGVRRTKSAQSDAGF